MSLINREELLRRLNSHGRRRDGKKVTPEWLQVAIKEVEHMPEGDHSLIDELRAEKAHWVPDGVRLAQSDDGSFSQARGFVLKFKCSYCGTIQEGWTGAVCDCGAHMANGDIDCDIETVLDRFSFWRPFPELNGGIVYACQKCGYFDGGTDKTCPNCKSIMLNGTGLHPAEYRDTNRYETMCSSEVPYETGLERDIDKIETEKLLK